MSIVESIDGADGYSTALRLSAAELDLIRARITEQWLATIDRVAPRSVGELRTLGLARYHELASMLDHAAVWPKSARILPSDVAASIRQMGFFRSLESELGPLQISDEDEVGWEEVYWRLVRPGEPNDMGPLHADAWFWELGHGVTPAGYRRIKIWVAVITEPGRNGLRVVPGSHRREWRYHGVACDGKVKPRIDEPESELAVQLLPTVPGDAVVFHDRLLHGGAPNHGTTTRVSFELTIFARDRAGHA